MSRTFTAVALFFLIPALRAAEPQVKELRTQKVGGTTYFEVSLALPRGCELPPLGDHWPGCRAWCRATAERARSVTGCPIRSSQRRSAS